MATVVLISCTRTQKPGMHKARDLYYASSYFKKCLAYAEEVVKADKIYVLSTKHHVVSLDEKLEQYDFPAPKEGWREWGKYVLKQLPPVCDLEHDHFVLLASAHYIDYIKGYMAHKEIPMEGLRNGERLAWLNARLKREGEKMEPHRTLCREDFLAALQNQFAAAQKQGLSAVDVNSGNLHRQVGGFHGSNHRMPMCCSAMRSVMRGEDTIIQSPPRGSGAHLTIRYTLPR